MSGYVGNSFSNTLSRSKKEKFKNVKGTVAIGAFDFGYNGHNWIVRGNFDYGHLSDAQLISEYNMGMSSNSPSPKQAVASDAIAAGIEAGYDLFSQLTFSHSLKKQEPKTRNSTSSGDMIIMTQCTKPAD